MSRELNKYVKDSLKNGVNEKTLKYNLQAAGWSDEEINKAFSNANNVPKGLMISAFILVSLIAVGGFSVIFVNLQDLASPPTNGEVSMQSCDILPNGQAKINCYEEKVQESYNCRDIVDSTERLFCLRALENFYLQQA